VKRAPAKKPATPATPAAVAAPAGATSREALASAPRIDDLAVAVYEIPTDQPEADGTLAWEKTTLVMVEAHGGGARGIGYTYATRACKPLIDDVLAPVVAGASAMDVAGNWQAMVRAIRNLGRPGVVSCAISAVDTALWDLKARLLGLSVCSLLGVVHDEAPIYGSGGFTTYDDATARVQLEHWVGELGIPRVKIKVGESRGCEVARDLRRIEFARDVIGPAAQLYVDANGAYARKQAIRVARAMADANVTWFEEPVSSDDLVGLKEIRDQIDADIAAGEYGYDLVYFARMAAARAVDCLQVDVTRCGGISEWLRVAAVAAAHGLDVSGHCAPSLHAHVATAIPNLRHLEYFHDHVRIEGMLFDGVLDPSGGSLRPDQTRLGFGLEFKRPDADQFRVA